MDEVRLFMDEDGRLFVMPRSGDSLCVVPIIPHDGNGVFADIIKREDMDGN